MKTSYAYWAYAALLAIPLIALLAGGGWVVAARSPAAFILFLGKAAAFCGLAAYCLGPVLSLRRNWLERVFGGLDSAYNLHALNGKLSFFLILAHPLLLAGGLILGGASLAGIWDWSSLLIASGLLALVSLIVLTGFAVYSHIKHQNWIIIHRLMGWLIPIMFGHALLAQSRLIGNRWLFFYMVGLAVAGMAAFTYRSLLGSRLVNKYDYEVAETNSLTPLVTELVLKPLGRPISYQPGQFAYVSIMSDVIDHEFHPFSFSTADNGPIVRFTIKQLGDDTTNIKRVSPGTPVKLEGPYGVFAQHGSVATNQVWIAGGVGIVPFLSMARSLSADSPQTIKLFYAAEKLEDAVFLRELLSIQKAIPEVFAMTVVSQQTSGFVTIDMLHKEIMNMADYYYLICGPPPMMKALKTTLVKNGVKPWQIITEEFSIR